MPETTTKACALCHKIAALSRSHIVPNFAFKPIAGTNGHAWVRSAYVNERPRKVQTGEWERLLCAECESRISEWESYAAKVLHSQTLSVTQLAPDLYQVAGIDYRRFKLFQMSVLWRCAVSTRPAFVKVQLGPREERLRKMLLTGSPGDELEFCCWMVALRLGGVQMTGAQFSPAMNRNGNVRFVRMVFGGYAWVYFTTSIVPESILHTVVRKDGSMVMKVADADGIPFLNASIDQFAEVDRFRRLKRAGL